MSRRKKVAKAAKAVPFNATDVANIVKANPYIQRLIEDADLRDNVRTAIDSTRGVYDRLTNGKTTVKSLAEDKKLKKEIRQAFEAVREVTNGLSEPKMKRKARKGFGFGRLLGLGIIGGGAALALNEGLRSKVLDALFGAEEEFNYTPPTGASTTSSTPAAAPVTAS